MLGQYRTWRGKRVGSYLFAGITLLVHRHAPLAPRYNEPCRAKKNKENSALKWELGHGAEVPHRNSVFRYKNNSRDHANWGT
eukprot:3830283-Rhodomonas_salina.1